jgi:putative Holliday junction resolvase
MRLLGIDYGDKRVGLALSDESGHFALPLKVVENSSRLVADVVALCQERAVATVVIGESKNWQGQDNVIMKRVNYFVGKLREAGLTVVFEPELLTSAEAERLEGKTPMLDAAAAALILKSYIDRQSP